MHTIVLGKFGSGKSKYGTQLVLDELIHGTRPIVTTLALRIDRLNEYVQTLTDRDCRVWQRVFVLDKNQVKHFWRYRGVESLGEYGQQPIRWGPVGNSAGEPADPQWENVSQGVFYVIDEATAAFHARRYAETGTEFSDYITQHRKLSDDVNSMGRSSAMLDKQFRLTADRCVVMENWYKRAVRFLLAPIKAPSKIVGSVYENCPPEKGEDPVSKFTLHIDPKGIDSCYDTAKGLGIAGTGSADVGKVARGLPWWSVIPAALAMGVVGWFIVTGVVNHGFGWVLGKAKVGPTPPPASQTTNLLTAAAHMPLPPPQAAPAPPQAAPMMPGFGVDRSMPVPLIQAVCKGWAIVNGTMFVLSDMGTIPLSNWHFRADTIIADGVQWRKAPASQSPSFPANPRTK